ncbi:hypothetical protein Ctob_000699 [Chrysochromulina tobinii]|uniref:Uncharacterized protein n=1 Tax=Chrysochromulina tobinii TaxID=1460289 RepID=A0A0M0J697_9EUKA|nr:hypothetical protein Ctob_000699 [Chrysochromulina tobinii]|eukprot:KOO22139.1 hypothetical protein Ctob_000699 [Chrysochromulina sp. CCMP291]
MFLTRAVEKGEELYNSYGRYDEDARGSPEIFRDYSFVEQYPSEWWFYDAACAAATPTPQLSEATCLKHHFTLVDGSSGAQWPIAVVNGRHASSPTSSSIKSLWFLVPPGVIGGEEVTAEGPTGSAVVTLPEGKVGGDKYEILFVDSAEDLRQSRALGAQALVKELESVMARRRLVISSLEVPASALSSRTARAESATTRAAKEKAVGEAKAKTESSKVIQKKRALIGKQVQLIDGPHLGKVGTVRDYKEADSTYEVAVGAERVVGISATGLRPITPAIAAMLEPQAKTIREHLMGSPSRTDLRSAMKEAVLFHRDGRFLHFFAPLPGCASNAEDEARGLVLAFAALAQQRLSDGDQKCDYALHIDPAFLAKEPSPPWFCQVKSISSKGMAFALFDKSDDAYGRKTGKPRRELGILSYSYPKDEVVQFPLPLQLVIPLVHEDGSAEQFVPDAPERSMAAAYQSGNRSKLLTLNGMANCVAGGEVELHLDDDEQVFEASVCEPGHWRIRYRHPLSPCQACAVALSILHNPMTQGFDTLAPKASELPPEALAIRAGVLAAEATAALGRGGSFRDAHDRYYKPTADKLTGAQVRDLIDSYPGSAEDLASGLADVLAKVGLGERLAGALKWASERNVSSLDALLGLLLLQESQWESLLAAIGPTKSYHRMRIQTQLKKVTDIKVTQFSSDIYWAKFDTGPSEIDTFNDDIEE